MVLKFRVLSDENDYFVREYEALGNMSLFEFHQFICSDLKYDDDTLTSFFVSDSHWEKLAEYTLFDMGESEADTGALTMDKARIGQIAGKLHERLIFQFDIIDERALFMELVEISEPQPDTAYPRVARSEGDAPDMIGGGAAQSSGSIFDDAMEEFGSFEGDDSYDDE